MRRNEAGRQLLTSSLSDSAGCMCMYVCKDDDDDKIRRHQHTRVHAHTGPRRHTRAPACHRHHIPRLVRRQLCGLAFTRYCLIHFEALLHNNIFCKDPLYCAINILHNITSYCTPPPKFEVFGGVWRFFFFFRDRILDGSRCLKKKSCQTRKRGHYCTLLCDTPLPAPLFCLQYCAIYFPHDPLYCNK